MVHAPDGSHPLRSNRSLRIGLGFSPCSSSAPIRLALTLQVHSKRSVGSTSARNLWAAAGSLSEPKTLHPTGPLLGDRSRPVGSDWQSPVPSPVQRPER